MPLIPIIALVLGFELFWKYGAWTAQEATARYTAIAVLAGLDTIVGGVRAWQTDKFDEAVFISGFFVNALLAVGLVALGEHLGLETGLGEGRISVMMIGAVVVFSGRILNNLAVIRRWIIDWWRAREAVRRGLAGAELEKAKA